MLCLTLQPDVAQREYVANISLVGADERIRLWVDSYLLVDQWASLDSTRISAPRVFDSTGYHTLVVDYKQEFGSAGASLGWTGPGYSLARFEALPSSPVRLTVEAGRVDLAHSKVYGSALTVATACMLAQFTIMARDVYGNAQHVDASSPKWELAVVPWRFTGRHVATLVKTGRAFVGQVSCSIDAYSCTMQYRTTAPGRYVVVVRTKVDEGGLAGLRNVVGSPFEVQVRPGVMDVRFSQLAGGGLTLGTAGIESKFTVLARDCANTAVPTPAAMVSIYQFEIIDAAGQRRGAPVSARLVGEQVLASIVCTVAGRYSLSVGSRAGKLRGSPTIFECRAGRPVYEHSSSYGTALSLSTAGSKSKFDVVLRDRYGNLADGYPCAIEITRIGIENSTGVPSWHAQTGKCNMTWMRTISGLYSIQAGYMRESSLSSTYYRQNDLSLPVVSFRSLAINSSHMLGTVSPMRASGGIMNDSYSVRWLGFIRPTLSQAYTFKASAAMDERIKLWVDSQLLVDQWSSLTTTTMLGTFKFRYCGVFYSIQIEYSSNMTGVASGVSLEWQAPSLSRTTSVGYYSFSEVGAPFVAQVVGSQLSGLASYAQGPALTLMTSGQQSSFLVHGRDAFGNRATASDLAIHVFVSSHDMPIPILSTSTLGPGEWSVAIAAHTRSGSYALHVGIFESHGLWATYYSDPYFQKASVVKTDPRLDFAWGASRPVTGVADEYFSVRWSGWISSRYTEQYLLYLYGAVDPDLYRQAPDCAKYTVGDRARDLRIGSATVVPAANRTVLDLCASNGWRQLGMWERAFHFDAGHMYSLEIEYKASIGAAGCKLRWSSARQMPDFVPPEFLHRFSLVQGSPSQLQVVERRGDNEARCVPSGAGLSLVTAGSRTSFLVLCCDRYGNSLQSRDDILAHVRNDQSIPFLSYIPIEKSKSEHTFGFVLTQSGQYSIDIFNFRAGYLSATYYDNAFFHPFYARKSSIRAAVSTNLGMEAPPGVALPRPFGVRWAGFLDFNRSGNDVLTPFLSVDLGAKDERVKLWLDNVLVIDQWGSLTSRTNLSASLLLPNGRSITEFRILYAGGANITTGMNLTSNARSPIPPQVFLAASSATGRSSDLFETEGVTANVQPAAFCAAASMVFGSGVSSGAVASTSTFRILLRDEYGNAAVFPRQRTEFLMKSKDPPLLLQGTTHELGGKKADLSVSYDIGPSSAGRYPEVSYLYLGEGLQATFYKLTGDNHSTDGVIHGPALSMTTDFSMTSHAEIHTSVSNPFSIRWSGFIKATLPQTYTLYPTMTGEDERVKLWVDSKLVVDQWSSLNSTQPLGTVRFSAAQFYDVAIEYKQITGAGGFSLKGSGILARDMGIDWIDPDPSPRVLPKSLLSHGQLMSGKTFEFQLNHGPASSNYTRVAGNFLTLSTAGVSSVFTIDARDAGGARVGVNSTAGYQVLGLLEWFGPFENDYDRSQYQRRAIVTWRESVTNRSRTFPYSLTLSGLYKAAISMYARGGLSATYWDNMHHQFLNEKSASVRKDSVLAFKWSHQNPIISDGLASVNSYASVKWDGCILPGHSETYTLILTLEADNLRRNGRYCPFCHDVAQVFVNGVEHVVTDRTEMAPSTMAFSPDALPTEHLVRIKFDKGILQHLRVVMRHYEGEAVLKLEWTSLSTPRTVIPSARLYHFVDTLGLGPLRMVVRSGARNASASKVEPVAGTMTAGVDMSFTLTSLDSFGNPASISGPSAGESVLYTRAAEQNSAAVQGNLSSIAKSNKEVAVVRTTQSGATQVQVLFMYAGGLRGKYVVTNASKISTSTRFDSTLNASMSRRALSDFVPIGVNGSLHVNWSGFIRPTLTGSYTFYTALAETDDRLKLWIDNQLIIDQWTSLEATTADRSVHFSRPNGYYELLMEYAQESVESDGVWGTGLSWRHPAWAEQRAVGSDYLLVSEHVGKSPMTFSTVPHNVSTVSSASGVGLTLASAGVIASFTITALDKFGNRAGFDASPFVPHLACNDSAALNPTSSIVGTGLERVTYITSYSRSFCTLGILLNGQHHISGSPWMLSLNLGPAIPTLSTMVGDVLSLMTAGMVSKYSIVSRDIYGASKPADGNYFVAAFYAGLDGRAAKVFSFNSSEGGLSEYAGNMLVSVSGNYSVHIGRIPTPGAGLRAQYYQQPSLETILAEQVASPNLIGSPHPLIRGAQGFSARWRGFLRMPAAREYTIGPRLSAAQDRVRMWMDSKLVIDQWGSLTSLVPTSSGTILSNEMVSFSHIEIEYSHPYGRSAIELEWAAGGSATSKISDENFYAALEHISSSPFSWQVVPGPAMNLIPAGYGLSLGTVGLMSQFSVVSKDQYGNTRDEWENDFNITLSSQNETGAVHSHPDAAFSRSGARHTIQYRAPTSAGHHFLYAFCPNRGGVASTYYSDANMSVPVENRIDHQIDFSGLSHKTPSKMIAANTSWGVRWSGFVRPSFAQVYTLHAVVASADERVRLWVDNQLIVNAWDSLAGTESQGTVYFANRGGYYQLIMDYKLSARDSYGVALQWSGTQIPQESIPKFWWNGVIINSPFRILVLTGGGGSGNVDTSFSKRGFLGNTVNSTFTAGTHIAYRLQTQDAYGNDLELDCQEMPYDFCPQIPFSIFLHEVASPDATSVTLQAERAFRDGYAFFSFTPTISGTYDVQIHLMRQSSTLIRSYRPFSSENLDILTAFKTAVSTASEACPTPTNFHISGFFFAKRKGVVMFQLKATHLAQFYIDRQKVVSFSAGIAGEARGEIYLTSDRPYEFSLQNQACSSDHKPAEVLWRFADEDPYESIPMSNLFYQPDGLSKSRFSIKVEPAAFCFACSTAHGSGLTLAVASQPAYFTIFAKDRYCNMLAEKESFVVRLLLDGSVKQSWSVGQSHDSGRYPIRYSTLYPHGIYKLYLSHLTSRGLTATYYGGDSGSAGSAVLQSPSIDFSGASGSTLAAGFAVASRPFSIRWAGFLQPALAQEYTFHTRISGISERVKLWIDSRLVIDQWSSLNSTEESGSFAFAQAEGFYEVVMEYKQLDDGPFAAELKWESTSVPQAIISSQYLWTMTDFYHSLLRIQPIWNVSAAFDVSKHLSPNTRQLVVSGGSPLTIRGFGFNTSAKVYTCLFFGREFSSSLPVTAFNSTALVCYTPPWCGEGSEVGFTLKVDDIAAPDWSQLTAQFRLQGLLLSVKPRKSNAAGITNVTLSGIGFDAGNAQICSFRGSFDNFRGDETVTQDSRASLSKGRSISSCFASVDHAGTGSGSSDILWDPLTSIRRGLSATYYTNTNLSNAAVSAVNFEIDFSKSYGSSLLSKSASGGTQLSRSITSGGLSIRWAGFIKPELAVTYTMQAGLNDIDERVKMWVDNALIVDQWSSLHTTGGSATWGFANANSYYDISMEYQQHHGSMGLQLLWKRHDEAFTVVSSDRLFLPRPAWGHASVSLVAESNGLMATYYSTSSFESALFSKIDKSIRQQQYDIQPIKPDYSIRWSGFIQPSLAQIYTMYTALTESDQRVRLWVDNQLLIDQWTSLTGTQLDGTIAFGAPSAYYKLLVEYRQRGPAPLGATLSWKSGSRISSVVPTTALFVKSSRLEGEHQVAGSTRFTFAGTSSCCYGLSLCNSSLHLIC